MSDDIRRAYIPRLLSDDAFSVWVVRLRIIIKKLLANAHCLDGLENRRYIVNAEKRAIECQ